MALTSIKAFWCGILDVQFVHSVKRGSVGNTQLLTRAKINAACLNEFLEFESFRREALTRKGALIARALNRIITVHGECRYKNWFERERRK